MDIKKIISATDHTELCQCVMWEDIKRLCDEATAFGTASVCIPPCYVKGASEYLEGRIPVCTVIGFPNGYMTTDTKLFETENAISNGADEIDMVINIGMLKSGDADGVCSEISRIKTVCGDKILKVIVETCLLTEDEKALACDIVSRSGADFIKTSTGFSSGGATAKDISLFAENIKNGVRIKAAGGISTLADAEKFLSLGASRLGSSRIIKLVRETMI